MYVARSSIELTQTTFSSRYVVHASCTGYYVIVDDHIPCQGDRPSCARSRNRNEVWVMVLEKAFAKLHTCYQSMVGGSNTYCFGPANVLRALTASPAYQIRTNRADFTVDDLWKEVTSRTEKGWIVGCGTGPHGKSMGLVPNHAYSVTGSMELDAGKIRLLRVRNTWGRREWTGKWNDRDDANWTLQRRRQVVKKFGTFQKKDDGTFFISVEDFKGTCTRTLAPSYVRSRALMSFV